MTTGPKKAVPWKATIGRADVLPHEPDPLGVALAQLLVELVGVGDVGELGRQPDLRERLPDDLVVVLDPARVDPGAHRRVEREHDVVAVLLLGGDDDTHRAPGAVQRRPVVLGQVPALVEDRQAHDVPPDVDRPHLLDLEHPAGGHPRPRADGVEPEVGYQLARTCAHPFRHPVRGGAHMPSCPQERTASLSSSRPSASMRLQRPAARPAVQATPPPGVAPHAGAGPTPRARRRRPRRLRRRASVHGGSGAAETTGAASLACGSATVQSYRRSGRDVRALDTDADAPRPRGVEHVGREHPATVALGTQVGGRRPARALER